MWLLLSFASWIWELGHARLIIQSDGEPAILALVAAVRDKVIADGKAGSNHVSGFTEGFARVQRSGRTYCATGERYGGVYLEHVREKTGSEFPPKSPWWAWALRRAG